MSLLRLERPEVVVDYLAYMQRDESPSCRRIFTTTVSRDVNAF